MEEMTTIDWLVLGTKVAMQLVLIIAPIAIALMEKKKVEVATIARAVSDSVAVVAKEIEQGKTKKGAEAKARALELAGQAAGKKNGFKGRSLNLADLAVEGEVRRRKEQA